MTPEGRTGWERLADLFAILSEVFLEPEADPVRRLRRLEAESLAGGAWPDPLRSALLGMAECEETPVQRGTEYVRLFFHGAGNAAAHPYESVYSHGRLMAPECLSALHELYSEAEVHPRADLSIPPDHIGLELEFLSYLLEQLGAHGADAAKWALLCRRLVSEHLAPFAARFVEKLEAASPGPYLHWAGESLRLGLEQCDAELRSAEAERRGR